MEQDFTEPIELTPMQRILAQIHSTPKRKRHKFNKPVPTESSKIVFGNPVRALKSYNTRGLVS